MNDGDLNHTQIDGVLVRRNDTPCHAPQLKSWRWSDEDTCWEGGRAGGRHENNNEDEVTNEPDRLTN